MRTLTIEYGPGAGDFGRTASGFDVVDEYGQRCHGLCMGEMLEQVVGLVVQGRARYRMLTPDQWEADRKKSMARGEANRALSLSRLGRIEKAAARLHAINVAMDADNPFDPPEEGEYQAAMAEMQEALALPA